jgi:signal transduction histidine kinase
MPATNDHLSADILVAEGERVVAADLTASLEDWGYHVVGEVASGEAVLREAARYQPDLVLMDVKLDGPMDGLAAADQLRRDWDIPVIFLASLAEAGVLEEAGAVQPVDYLVKPFADRDLRAAIETSISRHKTESRLRLERKLLEAQKLESLGLLAGGIAHDFNNLLAGIGGNAALCRMKLIPSSPLHEHLHKIQTTCHRAAELCKQMLAYAGKGKFQVVPLDLSALVSETTRLLHTTANKKAEIKLELTPELPAVLADPSQLQQIVMNLVSNAADAIGNCPGEIRLKTGTMWAGRSDFASAVHAPNLPEGDYVWLEVEDNGCGMPAEILARIFDPFFTTKVASRGVGLAAVLGIVRGHHGALLVESSPGKGSVFRLLFPASACTVQEPQVRDGAMAPQPTKWRGSGKVLVVDDEEVVRKVLAALLQEFGFDPVEAPDGRAALSLCAAGKETFRLVLLDLTMPLMDGSETLTALRRIYPGLPVVFMSGYSEQEASVRVGDDTRSVFLQKPFLPNQLKQKLWSILQ